MRHGSLKIMSALWNMYQLYPSRSTINNLISRIVVYDNGETKEVKVFFKFKEFEYIASKLI